MMMETRLKTEFDQIFLLVKVGETSNYKRKMILQNKITGFLSCKFTHEGTDSYLSYDVTAKKSLTKKFSEEKMKTADLEKLFEAISFAIGKAKEYLLESQNICMDPDSIFFDIDTEDLFLLYHPDMSYERERQYRKLAEFILDKVDHREETGVKIAYQFYKLSKEEFFSLENFRSYIEKERLLYTKKNESKEWKYEKQEEEEVRERAESKKEELEIEEETGRKFSKLKKKLEDFFPFAIGKKKEEQIEEEIRMAEQTTINEYFGQEVDEKTVFFDDHFVLRWKEHHFSREFELSTFPVHVGKLKGSDRMVIEEESVSRVHAKIREENGRIYLQDLNSTNGTYVNGIRLEALEEMAIHREDELQFGKVTVMVS